MPLGPIKYWPFKVFAKLRKSPLLIAYIVDGAVSGLRRFLATHSPWKMMKNAFYFILKALFVVFSLFQDFVLSFCSCRKDVSIGKMGLISKVMASKLVNKKLQYTYCPISPKVKTMKFGQVIEYEQINISLQKSCRKWGGTSSRPLLLESFILGKSKRSAT